MWVLLLHRINAGGLNEEDLYGRSTREPFRSFCRELSTKILNVVSSSSSSDQQQVQLLKGAVNAVHRTSSTESGSQGGRLDRTLARVIVALNRELPLSCFLRGKYLFSHF